MTSPTSTLLFLIAAAGTFLSATLAPAATISIGTVYVSDPGVTLQIPVSVSATQDLAGVNLRAEFDATALTNPEVTRGPLLSSPSHKLSWSSPTTGALSIAAWAPAGAPKFASASGVVFTIQLKVSSAATRGRAYPIQFSSLGPGNLAPSGICSFSGSAVSHDESEGQAVFPRYAPIAVSAISRTRYATGHLLPGSNVYTTGSVTFKDPVESALLGHTYLLTDPTDRDATGNSFLQFTIDQRAVVYIALDERISPPPAWVSTWARRAYSLSTSEPAGSRRTLYSRVFPVGKVTLGANRASGMPSGRNMYSVVIVPDVTAAGDWLLYEE